MARQLRMCFHVVSDDRGDVRVLLDMPGRERELILRGPANSVQEALTVGQTAERDALVGLFVALTVLPKEEQRLGQPIGLAVPPILHRWPNARRLLGHELRAPGVIVRLREACARRLLLVLHDAGQVVLLDGAYFWGPDTPLLERPCVPPQDCFPWPQACMALPDGLLERAICTEGLPPLGLHEGECGIVVRLSEHGIAVTRGWRTAATAPPAEVRSPAPRPQRAPPVALKGLQWRASQGWRSPGAPEACLERLLGTVHARARAVLVLTDGSARTGLCAAAACSIWAAGSEAAPVAEAAFAARAGEHNEVAEALALFVAFRRAAALQRQEPGLPVVVVPDHTANLGVLLGSGAPRPLQALFLRAACVQIALHLARGGSGAVLHVASRSACECAGLTDGAVVWGRKAWPAHRAANERGRMEALAAQRPALPLASELKQAAEAWPWKADLLEFARGRAPQGMDIRGLSLSLSTAGHVWLRDRGLLNGDAPRSWEEIL